MTEVLLSAQRGIVGGYIVNNLVRNGERPIALSRSQRASTAEVEWFEGDLNAPETLNLPPVTTLYCTAHVASMCRHGVVVPLFRAVNSRRCFHVDQHFCHASAESELLSERESVRRWAEAEQRDLSSTCDRLGIEWTVITSHHHL